MGKDVPVSVVEAHVSELVASYWDQHESSPALVEPEFSAPPATPGSPFVLVEPSVNVPVRMVGDDSKWAPMLAEALLLDRPEVLSGDRADPLFQSNLTIAGMLLNSAPETETIIAEAPVTLAESEFDVLDVVQDSEAPGVAAEFEIEVASAEATPTCDFEDALTPVWEDQKAEPLVEAQARPTLPMVIGPETQLMSSAAWLLGLEPMPMISAAESVAVVPGRSEAGDVVVSSSPTTLNPGAEIPDRIEIPEHLARVPADVPPVPQIESVPMRPITKGFLTKVLETVDARPKTVPLTPLNDLPKPKLAIPLAASDAPMTFPLAMAAAHELNPSSAVKPIARPTSWLAAELAASIPPTPVSEPEPEKVQSRRIQPLAPATAGEKKAWLEWWK